MTKISLLCSALLLTGALIIGCQPFDDANVGELKSPSLPAVEYDYALNMPASFNNPGDFIIIDSLFVDPGSINIDPTLIDPGFINFVGFGFNPENPKITNAGATLGRVLFYDGRLSLNNAISCGSCHKQNLAFADDGSGSVGFGGKVTPRNSMAIVNPGFNHNLFWDSRSSSVLDLVTKPIQNHIEMGIEDMPALTRKLAAVDFYPPLFTKAFGDPTITEERIALALAEFVCSISSANSAFDREQTNNFAGYTSLEKMGRDLFFSTRAKCSQCHAGANFAAEDFPGGEYGDSFGGGESPKGTANIGLELVYQDPGKEDGKFRIPTLRNIALTAPYMHDGRFKTLLDVAEHYNSGVVPHTRLDPKLRQADGSPQRLGLNELEKRALVAFLGTLTDESLINDPKFSNPFK